MGCKNALSLATLGLFALTVATTTASAQKAYGPGVTDTEIKLGTTWPFSGPASAYSVHPVTVGAYFAMVNEQGGINGRKVNFIALDDAYSPPKTVEQTRKLVEDEGVLALLAPLGTATLNAVAKYVNDKKVPDLFVTTGTSIFNDPERYPWITMGGSAPYASEGAVYGKYLRKEKPDARIGVLWQNDDFGRDCVSGLRRALGDKAATMIVAEQTYNVTDATVDSQMLSLKASGADTLLLFTTAKATSQGIKKAWELDWHPLTFLISGSSSIAGILQPAGLDASKGVISATPMKDPNDPQWANDPEVKTWTAFMDKYNSRVPKREYGAALAYNVATAMKNILKMAGDNLTRENIMKIATNLDMELPLLLPGVKAHTTPQDRRVFRQMKLMRFNGERYELFGDLLQGD